MSYIAGKQEKLVTRGLVYAVDGIDHGTFPGNGSSSTTYGDLVGQNDGTLYNKTTYRYHKQGILSFNGDESSQTYVSIPTSVGSAISNSSFTIGIWVRLNNASTSSGNGNGTEPLICFNGDGTTRRCISISRTGTSGATNEQERLGMFFFGDDLVANTTQVTTIMGTKWTYVVGTFNSSGNTQTLYINGSQHSTRTAGGSPNPGAVTGMIGRNDIFSNHLGGSSTSDPVLDGQIGPVHIYDRTLSAAEVLENYNVWKLRFQDSSGDGTDNGITDAGANIVTSNLVAHYDMGSPVCNPGSGTTITDLGGSNNGTISGATYSKINGGVLDFDGSNDDFEVTDSSDLRPTSAITLQGWINLDAKSGNYQHIAIKQSGVSSTAYGLWIKNTGELYAEINASSNSITGATSLATGTWLNIALTYDGSDIKLYLNGSQDASSSPGSITISHGSYPFDLFSGPFNDRIDGKLGSMLLYSSGLSAAQILSNYNATKSRFGL